MDFLTTDDTPAAVGPLSGGAIMSYGYNYDKTGHVLQKTTEHGDYAYGYDAVYRLTDADTPFDDESYTYDGVGNRTSDAATDVFDYNANNELTVRDAAAFTYDFNGNLTQKDDGAQVVDYAYTIANRLRQVTTGGSVTAEYYYDPFGRRLWKEAGGTRIYYHYSAEGLVAEIDAAGAITKTYGYKPGDSWTHDPLFMEEGGQYFYYHNDHLGTPQKMTATNGAVVWSAYYDSFGDAEVDVATVENNLRFPGQYYDAESGLHWNRFRYYDPVIGRYLRLDPIGFSSGNFNLFLYVLNNPISMIDPFGLEPSAGGGPQECLCEKDKKLIKEIFNKTVKTMTDNLERVDPGGWNNLLIDVYKVMNHFQEGEWVTNLKSCAEQSWTVIGELNKALSNNEFSVDGWTFSDPSSITGTHTWVMATNPECGKVLLDPLYNIGGR